MKAIGSLPHSPTAGSYLNLIGSTIDDFSEVSNICSQYLAIKNGANIKNPHPYAEGQCVYEYGGPQARISDIAKALVVARYGKEKSIERDVTLGSPSQWISAALSTGDLQKAISDAVSLIVMPSYDSLTEDIVRWTSPVEAKDFREVIFSNIDVDDIVETREGSEFKHGTIKGSGESFSLKTFGRNILVTRHMLINSEFDVIAAGVKAYAVSASRADAIIQYGVLNDNPSMRDGIPLFHDDHDNLMTPSVSPFTESLDAAMQMLRNQPTVSGEKSNAKTSIILVPPSLEGVAYNAANELLSGNNGKIEVISSAYLNDGSWYCFADPAHYPVVGRVMLEDSKTPLLIEPASSRQLGIKFDGAGLAVRLDVNAVALSHVGAVKVKTN